MSVTESLAAPLASHRAGVGAARMGAVRVWLFAMAALVFAMVLVGGATRLTESGLSITQWKPVTGVIPPLTEADWLAAFSEYKRIPQFAQLNAEMTLAGFKTIFYWEWTHRLLARFVGLAFIAPALWFWRTGRLAGPIGGQVLTATGLLALEPVVGWWMVASGLSERTEVAQERLALHLMIAAATFAALLWAAVGLRARSPSPASRRFAAWSGAIAILVFCQIGFGALVAGLRAGLTFNTWPLMDGRLIPEGLLLQTPWWPNLFEDVTTVQFQHRLLAYVIVALAVWQAAAAWRTVPATALARRALAVGGLALIQAALGVVALVLVVPIWAGLLHQACAMLLFGMAVAHWRATRLERAAAPAA